MKRSVVFLLFLFTSVAAAYDNTLVITIDTLRADYVSCYGSTKVRTPNIDSLAASGVRFHNTVAPAPFTLPSHVSLFTGLLPPNHGVRDNSGFALDKKIQTLAEVFRAQGFKTAAFVGAFAVDSRFGLDQGFETYDDSYVGESQISTPERSAGEVTDLALKWLGSVKTGQRWFVWIHLFDPHFPYQPPEKFKKISPDDPYAGEVAYADEQVGRLLRFLREKQLEKKTLVVLTSDHGESLGEHGEQTHGIFAYESTLRVPLVIAPLAPTVISTRVRLIDVAPTVLSLQGLSFDRPVQGQALLKNADKGLQDQDSYFESMSMYYNASWAPLDGFYSKTFKYIDLPLPELYDLQQDPRETRNLCVDRKLCDQWARKYAAFTRPLPNDAVPSTTVDPETAEQLRALGYIASTSRPERKTSYLPKDDPKNLLPLHNKVYAGLSLYAGGKSEKAIKVLEEVIAQKKDYVQAYLYAAYMMSQTGAPAKAAQLLKKGMQNGIKDSELQGRLGVYLFQAGQFHQAITELNAALKAQPLQIDFYHYLAMAYAGSGNPIEAEKTLQKCLSVDPSDETTWNNLGALYLSQKKHGEAIEAFQTALSYNPDAPNATAGLASAYAGLKNWEQAVKYWNQALKQDSKNYDVMLKLAFAYIELNQTDQALPLLQKFEQQAPADRYKEILPKISFLIRKLTESKTQ